MGEFDKSISSEVWNPRITEIINDYRNALLALIPVFENANIPWNDEDKYDRFEEIAQSLFNGIVIFNLEELLSNNDDIDSSFAKFGYYYKDYSKLSFIEVVTEDNDDAHFLVLVYLNSKNNSFDTVYCNKINTYGKVIEEGIELNFSDVKFRFQHRTHTGILNSY
jgi:hypothetical protein